MDKKTYTIGILSLTALVLFVANLMMPSRVQADFAVKDRNYQAVTARQQAGDEALYVLDNQSGLMAVFSYDPGRRALVARAVAPIQAAFAGALPPGR
jgi:hypothetical protein